MTPDPQDLVTPCPTCRHEVIHIARLEFEILGLRIRSRIHRGLRLELVRDVKAWRKAKRRHAENRCEHRDAIRALGEHLTEHAEERVA